MTTDPKYPLPKAHYFGPAKGEASHGGRDRHPGLEKWQWQMRARGWHLVADGRYGPQTNGVCRQFQAQKGLTIDGVIGPATWRAAWSTPVVGLDPQDVLDQEYNPDTDLADDDSDPSDTCGVEPDPDTYPVDDEDGDSDESPPEDLDHGKVS